MFSELHRIRRARIIGTGKYLPPRVVSNAELAGRLHTDADWILKRTGIRERRFVDDGVGASDLGLEAARAAIESAGLEPRDIDLILFATLSPDVFFPGSSCYLQAKLGIHGIPALDIRNQCTGFLYGLAVGEAFLAAGRYQRILLVGAEVHSSGLDLSERGRDISILFGDGAGAVVLGPAVDEDEGILALSLGADGREADSLMCVAPQSSRSPRISVEMLEKGLQFPRMNGRRVFKHAIEKLCDSILGILDQYKLTIFDIRCFVIHQANLRIIEKVAERLGLASGQLYTNADRYGNTTAASIPVALHEAVEKGLVGKGDLVVLSAFGSGFTWGSALIRW